MMVNDFDDERTLDEEEALEEADEQNAELSNLEKVLNHLKKKLLISKVLCIKHGLYYNSTVRICEIDMITGH